MKNKENAFAEIAETIKEQTIDNLCSLRNLANNENYEYDIDDVRDIVDEIQMYLDSVCAQYIMNDRSKTSSRDDNRSDSNKTKHVLNETTQVAYKTIYDASRDTGIIVGNIYSAIKRNITTSGGYTWRYLSREEAEIYELKEIPVKGKVHSGKHIAVRCVEDKRDFMTIAEAARTYNIDYNKLKYVLDYPDKTIDDKHWITIQNAEQL